VKKEKSIFKKSTNRKTEKKKKQEVGPKTEPKTGRADEGTGRGKRPPG